MIVFGSDPTRFNSIWSRIRCGDDYMTVSLLTYLRAHYHSTSDLISLLKRCSLSSENVRFHGYLIYCEPNHRMICIFWFLIFTGCTIFYSSLNCKLQVFEVLKHCWRYVRLLKQLKSMQKLEDSFYTIGCMSQRTCW